LEFKSPGNVVGAAQLPPDAREARLGHRRPWAWMADHVLFVFRKTGQE